MIIRATFRNIYSFNEETSISFVAGKGTTKPEHVDRAEGRDDISILKAGVVYGANASGKSNMVKAIYLIREILKTGLLPQYYNPFKLADNYGKPTKLELEFKFDSKYYAYGIEYDPQRICEEWLYEINKRTDKLIFNRVFRSNKYEYQFSQSIEKNESYPFLQFVAEGTPSNSCFLMEYVKRNGRGADEIFPVVYWFEKLTVAFPDTQIRGLSFQLQNVEFKKKFNEYLSYFNTGIKEVKLLPISFDNLNLSGNVINNIRYNLQINKGTFVGESAVDSYYFEKTENGIQAYRLKTIHKTADDREVAFEVGEESDGSIRLFDIIPMLISIAEYNIVFLIDELDRSMHTMLTKEIFRIYSKLLQKKNIQSQFICTTHESNLLSLESLREDEIWFAEKDETGSTHFTSLCEFEHRDNNKQKGYLNGRYGAIPFYGDINNIIND